MSDGKITADAAVVSALYSAGSKSLDAKHRMEIVCGETEPAAVIVDKDGNVRVDEKITEALREARPRPIVRREDLKLARVQDLVQHVLRFKQPGTVVFAERPKKCLPGSFTAVLDYSASRAPQELGWNRERAFIEVDLSDDAKKWHNAQHAQPAFANLIRDWARKISPNADGPDATSSALLTMAYDLEVTDRTVSKVTRNRQTGMYDVELKGDTTTSTTIYSSFGLEVAVIEGRMPRTVDVRCELYKSGQGYGFRTQIAHLDELVQSEFDEMCREIEEKAGVPVWQGMAPGVVPTSD